MIENLNSKSYETCTHSRISFKNRFTNEISEVKGVADVGHPAEQVGEAYDAKRLGHHHYGLEVMLER